MILLFKGKPYTIYTHMVRLMPQYCDQSRQIINKLQKLCKIEITRLFICCTHKTSNTQRQINIMSDIKVNTDMDSHRTASLDTN